MRGELGCVGLGTWRGLCGLPGRGRVSCGELVGREVTDKLRRYMYLMHSTQWVVVQRLRN